MLKLTREEAGILNCSGFKSGVLQHGLHNSRGQARHRNIQEARQASSTAGEALS